MNHEAVTQARRDCEAAKVEAERATQVEAEQREISQLEKKREKEGKKRREEEAKSEREEKKRKKDEEAARKAAARHKKTKRSAQSGRHVAAPARFDDGARWHILHVRSLLGGRM